MPTNRNANRAVAAEAKARKARIAALDAEDMAYTLESIAAEHLNMTTLETRRSSADFQEQATWTIKAALEAAYEAGRRAGAR
jgi:hypothetical protein